jgi:hypothetical protein
MVHKTEQSDEAPNDKKPEICYCSALPKGSGPCLPCYTRWLARSAKTRFPADDEWYDAAKGTSGQQSSPTSPIQ